MLSSGSFVAAVPRPTVWLVPSPAWRPLLGCGHRWGEALHPGPSSQTSLHCYFASDRTQEPRLPARPPATDASSSDKTSCVFAVVNPTSVLHKVPLLLRTEADVIAMSETSAVAAVQQMTQKHFTRHSFKVHWGQAVPSHSREDAAHPTLRGLAAGVALASRLPSHRSCPPLPEAASSTCRLSECFVRLGALQVRMLTIYGYPNSHLDARQRNEDLLAQAADRATQNALPCIIAGDFNMPPCDLPAGQALASLGYQEVFELHQHVHGEVLPPTCKGATRHDTALLHPALVPLFLRAWVLRGQQLFDAHDPLCFQLRMCENRPCRRTWRLPKPWAALGPDRAAFADAFRPAAARLKRQADACASVQDVEAALLSFSKAAEDAVQMTLVAQNRVDPLRAPHTTLPRSYRGRCVNRKPLQRELPCLLKPARSGGYQPDVEVTSVLGRMKVRQVRRVRTLQQGLLKLGRLPASHRDPLRHQLQLEWRAILRARGYPPTFSVWLLRVACFHSVPGDLPSPEWLHQLAQYLQHDCDALVRQQAQVRKDVFKYRLQVDAVDGHSKSGYRALRPESPPPFTEVPHCIVEKATAHWDAAVGCYELRVEACRPFRVPGPAVFAGVECSLLSCTQGGLLVSAASLPTTGELHQSLVACTAEELHDAFRCFWCPIWHRDSGPQARLLAEWPSFCALLAQQSPRDELRLRSCATDLWIPENRLLIVINKVVVLLIPAFNQLDHIDFKAHEIKAGIQ